MTNQQILQWIKSNLGPVSRQAIANARLLNPDLLYTEDWMGAIACRETGGIIAKYPGKPLADISAVTRGDFTKREGETEVQPHGFGFWQIDKDSFYDFWRSGDWKDPLKCCKKAIEVLEGKRKYLEAHFTFGGDALDMAITAAYNDGEGNEVKVLTAGQDFDIRTTDKDYSKQVWEFREIYKTLT